MEGLDLETLSNIKDDYRDEFETFSRTMLNSLDAVKSAVDTEQFSSEIRNVQRNMIDAGLSDVERTFKKISAISSLRKKGMMVGLFGLNAAVCFGAPALLLVSGLAAGIAKMAADKIDELKEQNQLRELKHYFLWKLGDLTKQA